MTRFDSQLSLEFCFYIFHIIFISTTWKGILLCVFRIPFQQHSPNVEHNLLHTNGLDSAILWIIFPSKLSSAEIQNAHSIFSFHFLFLLHSNSDMDITFNCTGRLNTVLSSWAISPLPSSLCTRSYHINKAFTKYIWHSQKQRAIKNSYELEKYDLTELFLVSVLKKPPTDFTKT